MGDFFAKKLLGNDFSEEKGKFVASVFQSAREGNLCLKAKGPALPSSVIEEGTVPFPKAPIVRDQDRYYLQRNWALETHLLNQIKRLTGRKSELPLDAIADEENLSPDQKKAVEHLFLNPFSILCGGPGTGKTHTIAYFIRAFLRSVPDGYRILLASPTGKAALHLQSSILSKVGIECEAMTLHRMLKLKPKETNLFSRTRIDAHLVIVDEASMMDASLLAHLLSSIGNETRLILMGDPNQLPPVDGPGIFAEMADLHGVFLKKCMRTEDPLLQQAAEAVLDGDEKSFFSCVEVNEFDEDFLYEKISPMVSSKKIDPKTFFEESKKLRVLDMLRKGPFGLEALNQKILERMSRDCPEGWWWAVPIMVTANLPLHNLYNGSSGVLIGKKQGRLNLFEGTAFFSEGGILINPPPHEVSFVLSVHKSQGSEFDEVVALFPPGSESFGKEALYTAATRAKKRLEIIGEKEVLSKILSQGKSVTSGFRERYLKKIIHNYHRK